MQVIVCSLNPTKIQATRVAVKEILEPDFGDIAIVSTEVDSGVSEMPMSKEECRRGARIRVENALKKFNGIVIGHEGGVVEVHGEWYLFGSTYASDGILHSWGGETMVHMPPRLVDMLEGGNIELGDVIDKLSHELGTKTRGGAIAFISKKRIQRMDLFVQPSKEALVRWLWS